MNSMEKTLYVLHGMFKTTKEIIKRNSNHVNMFLKESKKQRHFMKVKGKDKDKGKYEFSKTNAKPKYGSSFKDKGFYCGNLGHWSTSYKSIWKTRKRTEVKFLLEVYMLLKLILLFVLVKS